MYINILNKLKENLLCQTEDKIYLNVNKYHLEILNNKILHEVCLSCRSLPYFKYRMLLVSQEPSVEYPLIIYLDEDIAEELHMEEKIVCSDDIGFENIMINIMSSDKIDRVVKKLLEN